MTPSLRLSAGLLNVNKNSFGPSAPPVVQFSIKLNLYFFFLQIKEQETQVKVIERRQEIELQEQEIQRKEKELDSKVRKPAEAEKYMLETLAEAARQKAVLEAEAEAEAIALKVNKQIYISQCIIGGYK